MNRHVTFALVIAVITTTLLAVAAIGWRIYLVEALGVELRPRPLAPLILLAVPAILAAVLIASSHHLAAHVPGISEDNPRHMQAALLLNFLFVTVCQAWMGLLYVERPPPGGETAIRFAVVLIGVAIAVRGNFFAKLSPPSSPAISNQGGAWTRSALQVGRICTGLGAALVACGILLPLRPLLLACLAGAIALLLVAAAHWRAVRMR